jgi:hypothetical protein
LAGAEDWRENLLLRNGGRIAGNGDAHWLRKEIRFHDTAAVLSGGLWRDRLSPIPDSQEFPYRKVRATFFFFFSFFFLIQSSEID